MNILFICSRNQWRSPTAEAVYRKRPGLHVRSRGTSKKAARHVSEKDIKWADLIVTMERKHSRRLQAEHPEATKYKRIEVLGIPDEYHYMDESLISRIVELVDPILETI